jgi:hypothetical protein
MKLKQLSLVVAMLSLAVPASAKRIPPSPMRGPGSIPTTITFGNSSNGCVGRGVCVASSANIPVTFTLVSSSTLLVSFSMSDLSTYQSSQVSYFSGSSYMFDAPYSLTSSLFSDWGLDDGAMISTSSASSLSVVSGVVTDTITIAYSSPVSTNIIFGNPGSGPSCGTSGKGICYFSSSPIAATSTSPASIPVTFSLQPGNTGVLLMTFNMSDLYSAQYSQVAYFSLSSYMFSSTFSLTDAAFASLLLPANAKITSSCASSVSVVSGVVTDAITYTTN